MFVTVLAGGTLVGAMAMGSNNTITIGGHDVGSVAYILQSGIIGLVLLCILTKRWIVPAWALHKEEEAHTRDLADRDADIADLKQANSALRTLTEEQIIPALVRSNQLASEYAAQITADRLRGGG